MSDHDCTTPDNVAGTSRNIILIDNDEEGGSSSKRPKLDPESDDDDCCIVIPKPKTVKPPRKPPLFYLTKVRGIRDVFNGGHIAIGIKGTYIKYMLLLHVHVVLYALCRLCC